MAIAPVEKILIALHKSEEQRFLKCLQSLGVLHISHKQTVTPQNTQISLKETVDELYSVIEYLAEFQKKRNALISEKTPLTRREFETQGTNYKLLETLNEIKTYYTNIQQLEQKLKAIDSEVKFLKPWIKLKYDLSQLYGLKHLETIIGTFHSETDFKETINKISRYPVYYEIINQEKNDYYTIILIPKELFSTVYPLLDKIEIVNLRKYQGTISEIIVQNQKLCNHITNEIDEYYKKLQIISNELPKFKVIYDYYNNLLALEEIKNSLVITKEVIFIEGWIKSKDKSKLKSLTDEFNSVVFTNLPVTENDQIPVALENHKIFKPFEIILDLYTMPQPYEIDPTPLLAPFFTIFFALCLTDAGYGILLTVLSILLLKKLNVSNKFLNLLAICGGITIIAGMLTGSWFGDIFDKIGIDFLVRIKNSLTAFDPIKNPLPFFYLSLAIG
ncbi:MAG: hypothetical protein NZ601_05700, partial [candidate division WOR-3 bacterium]|nr:hypothetical protein [candidate division WOR-3 bacterium]